MQSGDGNDNDGSHCFPLLILRFPPRAQTHEQWQLVISFTMIIVQVSFSIVITIRRIVITVVESVEARKENSWLEEWCCVATCLLPTAPDSREESSRVAGHLTDMSPHQRQG